MYIYRVSKKEWFKIFFDNDDDDDEKLIEISSSFKCYTAPTTFSHAKIVNFFTKNLRGF